jgi:hypothetical protein
MAHAAIWIGEQAERCQAQRSLPPVVQVSADGLPQGLLKQPVGGPVVQAREWTPREPVGQEEGGEGIGRVEGLQERQESRYAQPFGAVVPTQRAG